MPIYAITALTVNNVGGKIQGGSGVEVCKYQWGSVGTLGSPLAAPSQVPTGNGPSPFPQRAPGVSGTRGVPGHSPHVATLYRHLQNYTCALPLHSCKSMEWEDVYKHMHTWGARGLEGVEAGLVWLQGRIPALSEAARVGAWMGVGQETQVRG